MRDVALMGRAGAGKDTVAEMLRERYGHVRVAFADPLREMALALDPIVDAPGDADAPDALRFTRLSDVVMAYGWDDAKREFPEVRRVLQRLGLEAVREVIGADTWVRLAHRSIVDAHNRKRWVALTDVRFPNEVALARHMGMLVLWIDRPGVTVGGHASETAVGPDDADAIVYNGAGKAELLARVETALAR